MTITDLQRSDFPVLREWIDPNLFRVFRAPIGDDQLERLLTRQHEGRTTDLGLKAIDGQDHPVGFLHMVFDWARDCRNSAGLLLWAVDTGSSLIKGFQRPSWFE